MAKANKKGKQKAQPQATERVADDEDLYGGGHLGTIPEDGESNAAAQAQQWNYATPDVGQNWNTEEEAGGWPVEDQQGQWSSAPEPPVSTDWQGAATPAGQPSGSTWGNWDRPTGAPSPAPAPQAQAAQHHQPAPGPSWQNWGAEAAARAAAQGFKPPPTAPRRAQPQHQYRAHFADPANRQDINPQARDEIYAALGRQPAPSQQSKQLKRSKREKQPPPVEQGYGGGAWPVQNDGGWDQSEQGYSGDEGWDNNNQGWGGWDDEPAGGGRSVRSDGGWDDEAARRAYRESLAQVYVPGPDAPSAYPMPSRTLAYASKLDPDALNMLSPGMARRRNGMSDFANLAFVESHGEALTPVLKALFGRERKARDRIHWKFRHDKDERVESLLMWIEEISPDLGAFGLNKFLQTRERGALITNASYHPNVTPLQPAFDWLTYNDAVNTRDKIIQESIGFYDPMVQVIVFVFLPSKTGNSVAMWRRKVTVPPGVRLAHVQEIKLAMAALKKDYPVYVDELQDPYTNGDASSGPVPPKKKRKGFWGRLFRSFRIRW